MDLLNDDCLLHIFNLLDLKDQIALASTCRRFEDIIGFVWQKVYSNLSINFGIEEITLNDFAALLEKICDTVREMKLKDLTYKRLEILKCHKYPNLESFSFTQWTRRQMLDDCILVMTEIFPNLVSFSPHGPFTGQYMEKWTKLKHLNLSFCSKVQFQNFEKIFETLNLKSLQLNIFELYFHWSSLIAFERFCNLEKVFLNTTELWWLSQLSECRNLKEVTISDRIEKRDLFDFLDNIQIYKSNDVSSISTCIDIIFLQVPQGVEFTNLRKILLQSLKVDGYTGIWRCAPNLQEIVLKHCKIPEAANIHEYLLNCKELSFLSIESCECEFPELQVDVEKNFRQRVNILRINFYENYYKDGPAMINLKGKNNQIKLSKNISTATSFQPLQVTFKGPDEG